MVYYCVFVTLFLLITLIIIKRCDKTPQHIVDTGDEVDALQATITKENSSLGELQMAYCIAHLYSIRMAIISIDRKLTVLGLAITAAILIHPMLNNLV
jgi:hypothetical protein